MNCRLQEFNYLLDLEGSEYNYVKAKQLICKILKEVIANFFPALFFSIRVRMSSNNAENSNQFLKLKPEIGLYHLVVETKITSTGNFARSFVEMQQIINIDETDHKNEIACVKWTKSVGRRQLCFNFRTDTDKS